MAIFQFGPIIKSKREELGYTQEELADGICSVPTLSRIENGDRMPTREHFEMLLQRLGYSDTMLDHFVDERQLHLHELKFQIRQEIMLNHLEKAKMLLSQYVQDIPSPSNIERQFILMCDTMVNTASYTPQQRLEIFESAIKLTYPKYEDGKLPKVISFEEIILLNNIAVSYSQMGNAEEAIRILYGLKVYYEHHVVNPEEILRTQPMILYNLSKCLGSSGRFDECIEIADQGIRISRETGRCTYMHGLLYNRAWSLVRRKRDGDLEAARTSAIQAYQFAVIMERGYSVELYKKFLRNNFPDVSF